MFNANVKKELYRIMCVVAVIMMILVLGLESANAATKTVKGCSYGIIKSGNKIYCTAGNKIYTLNAKTGKKVVFKKVKNSIEVNYLSKKGKYLYYANVGNAANMLTELYRVDLKTKRVKKLAKNIQQYCIKGKYIYYSRYKESGVEYKRMTLSGKKAKRIHEKVDSAYVEANKAAKKIKCVYINKFNTNGKVTKHIKSSTLGRVKLATYWGLL